MTDFVILTGKEVRARRWTVLYRRDLIELLNDRPAGAS